MREEIFADDVGRVEVISGVVRVELMQASLTRADSSDGKPSVHVQAAHELIFPPLGFSRAYKRMKSVVDQLIESGVVRQNEAENTPSGGGDG